MATSRLVAKQIIHAADSAAGRASSAQIWSLAARMQQLCVAMFRLDAAEE